MKTIRAIHTLVFPKDGRFVTVERDTVIPDLDDALADEFISMGAASLCQADPVTTEVVTETAAEVVTDTATDDNPSKFQKRGR